MKVISLFKSHSFGDIESHFAHLLKVNDHQILTTETMAHWKSLYEKWVSEANPQATEYHIHLVSRWEHCSPMVDMNCTVCDAQDAIQHPMALHSSRDEVFGMELIVDEDVSLSSAELTAGLFYEMTFYPPKKK